MADEQDSQSSNRQKQGGEGANGDEKKDAKQGSGEEHQDNEEQKKKPNPRRARFIRLIAIAVVVVAVLVMIPIFAYYSVRESTDDAQIDGHLIPISPRISGYVLQVMINDNQTVRAGESLVKLDPADYQVAMTQAQAQLLSSQADITQNQQNVPITTINTSSQVSTSTTQEQQARAGVEVSEQAINSARAKLTSSQAALAQAQSNFVKSQKDLARSKDLVTKDEISKQDYDGAVAAADADAARVEGARADVLAAQHALDQSIAQLDQAKAQLESAVIQRKQSQDTRRNQVEIVRARLKQSNAAVQGRQADLEQARLNLDYTILKAPVDGVVSRKSAEPGMQVSPGQQLMALVPLDDIWVTANYKETQLKKMRVGQKVEIEVDTYGSSRKYRGHVDSIAAASGAKFNLLPPENATGNYVKVVQRVPVKIVLEPGENRDRLLLPGMSVTPTVLLNSDTNGQQQ